MKKSALSLLSAAAVLLGLLTAPVHANNWGEMAMISDTMGVSGSRICIGEATRGDIGCPAYAPTISATGTLNISSGLVVNQVSLTTASTTWGYLGSGASYLPQLNAGTVSATTVSATTITTGTPLTNTHAANKAYVDAAISANAASGGGGGCGDLGYFNWSARGPSKSWLRIASSADGMRLIATEGTYLYTSTDGGITWTPRQSGANWHSVASSADGLRLIVGQTGAGSGRIYTSTDGGVTWTERTAAGAQNWYAVASSSDGMRLAAAATSNRIYISTDGGVSWVARESSRAWYGIASSADGMRLAAITSSNQIHTSADGGVTWTARESNRSWRDITSSADGMRLAAVVQNGQIYTSADGGVTWTARESSRNWRSITSSADGMRLAAAVYNGQIYLSEDGGVTWTPSESDRTWQSITSSADGSRIAVAELGSQIYIGSRSNCLTGASSVTVNSDRIISGTTGLTAQSGGVISITTNGVNTGYFDTTGRLVAPSVSATTAPLKSLAPVANADVATKEYVDTAVAAAGGGRPVYVGATTTTYNGAMGAISGVNAKCSQQFPDSRIMVASEIVKTDFSAVSPTVNGWIFCDEAASYTSNGNSQNIKCAYSDGIGVNTSFIRGLNCLNFRDQGTTAGGTIFLSSGAITDTSCNSSFAIHCVRD